MSTSATTTTDKGCRHPKIVVRTRKNYLKWRKQSFEENL